MAGITLPAELPGKSVGISLQVDANSNWVDVVDRRDDGTTWHLWYRPKGAGWDGGWQVEPLTALA